MNVLAFVITSMQLFAIAYIFFDDAVISLEALMMRSLRSWCSSNSARKLSNMGMKGDWPAVLSCSTMAA